MNKIDIKAPGDIVRNVLLNPDIILRLNPSWYIRKLDNIDKGLYDVTLYDDRTDDTLQIHLKVEEYEKSVSYEMNSQTIRFMVDEAGSSVTTLSIQGDLFREDDLKYWMKALRNYIILEVRQGGITKWFLDRFWLRMTPSQRRISIIIIIAEGIGLAALIAVIVAIQLMK